MDRSKSPSECCKSVCWRTCRFLRAADSSRNVCGSPVSVHRIDAAHYWWGKPRQAQLAAVSADVFVNRRSITHKSRLLVVLADVDYRNIH